MDQTSRSLMAMMMEFGKQNEAKTSLSPTNFTTKDLSQEDLDRIVSRYGVDIEDIFDLTSGQKWMFEKAHFVNSAFFLQMLIKAVVQIEPAKFRQRVDEVTKNRDNLRSAFVYRDMTSPYRVVLKNRSTELYFVDISRTPEEEIDEKLKELMASDRKKGFDLEKDSLLRITVFKTSEADTYAILVSQPHINSDGLSLSLLFKDIFIDYALNLNGIQSHLDSFSYKNYASWLQKVDISRELDYWKNTLKDCPELRFLPGQHTLSRDYDVNSYTVTLSDGLMEKLQRKQSIFKATLFNIYQAAWGIMLCRLYGTQDVTFAAITAGRDSEVPESMRLEGGFVGVIPVRVKFEKGKKISEVVSELQRQFTSSLQNSHCSPDEIQKALNRKTPIFNHLLNCHNFNSGSRNFSKMPRIPGLEFVGGDAFDNLSEDLCVYFINQGKALSCQFSYNGNSLAEAAVKKLAGFYEKMLEQIADADDLSVDQIECGNTHSFEDIEKDYETQLLEMTEFMSRLTVFEGVERTVLRRLCERCKIHTYGNGYTVLPAGKMSQMFSFVYFGTVILSGTGADGWMNPFMALKKGSMISATGILTDTVSTFSVEAGNDNVKILDIPREEMWRLIDQYPGIALNIIKDMEKRNNQLAFLWLKSI